MEVGSIDPRAGRSILERPARSRALDPLLQGVLATLAALILVLIAFFFVRLFVEAHPAFDRFGYFGFVFHSDWNVARSTYGALPLLTGTLITSFIALMIGVPIAVAVAVFIAELCPARFRATLSTLV